MSKISLPLTPHFSFLIQNENGRDPSLIQEGGFPLYSFMQTTSSSIIWQIIESQIYLIDCQVCSHCLICCLVDSLLLEAEIGKSILSGNLKYPNFVVYLSPAMQMTPINR